MLAVAILIFAALGAIDDAGGGLCVAVRAQDAFAAQAEQRDRNTGAPKGAAGKWRRHAAERKSFFSRRQTIRTPIINSVR
jgi:hypothetical protein